ncbi:MAG: Lrp/AsnC family transcriptional regulator [Tolumonas sp.]|nr:Lrp/AsnC family transcriptional regulator [Tolumonas sp.]MDD2841582.1 Lrp/AsnC family transcriptional regulator [Tolumonas sp.]
MQLDTFDTKILNIIQKNCRVQAEEIAEQVGLSASAVQRRLKKLRTEGVIQTEIAVIDPKYVPNIMTFIAGLEIERDNYVALNLFKAWSAGRNDIQQVYYVTGQYDLIVVVTAVNAAEYDKFSQELMEKVPQIRRITTHVVIDAPKRSFYVPIRTMLEE